MTSKPSTPDRYFPGSGDMDDSRLSPFAAVTYDPYQVKEMTCPVYKSPTDQSAMVTQLLYGETISVINKQGNQVQIVSHTDAYTGWVAENALYPVETQVNTIVSVPLSHLYEQPHLKTANPVPIAMGSRLSIVSEGTENGFLETCEGYYIYAAHTTPIEKWHADPVETALAFLNAPYVWGGRSAVGLDCSALMQLAFMAAGIPLHRDSDLQFQAPGHAPETPERGDLAFFPGHVGIMLDNTQLLHANATHMKVTIDPIDTVIGWIRDQGSQTPFLGFKRLIQS